MLNRKIFAVLTVVYAALFLNACGSDAHGAYNGSDQVAPTAATDLAGNAGDGAVSLGWNAPETGTQPLSYNVTIEPATTSATVISVGTHALIQGLTNDTTYTISVTAKNDSGESSAATVLLKPTAIDTSSFEQPTLDSTGDTNNLSGIADAALLYTTNSLWMTYSSINQYSSGGHVVRDVSTNLAYSDDSGATFTFLKTIAAATSAIITPNTVNPCGAITCNGHWVYAAPFLVDDQSDPDASKRYKLFAHKYFLYPPSAFYEVGAIVMWTAALPGSTWSSEQVVLSWNATPQELAATNPIKNIDASLAECTGLREGSATTYGDALDFVFACPNSAGTQKIVLLRTTDHAATFTYVSTPLTVADAVASGALYFSAPALLPTASSAPILIATPVKNRTLGGSTIAQDTHSGCIVFPFADEETGALFRNNSSTPLSILQIPYLTNHANGACAWDRGVGASGILMNDYDPSAIVPYSILNTKKRL